MAIGRYLFRRFALLSTIGVGILFTGCFAEFGVSLSVPTGSNSCTVATANMDRVSVQLRAVSVIAPSANYDSRLMLSLGSLSLLAPDLGTATSYFAAISESLTTSDHLSEVIFPFWVPLLPCLDVGGEAHLADFPC
jgi:hypothetical protein